MNGDYTNVEENLSEYDIIIKFFNDNVNLLNFEIDEFIFNHEQENKIAKTLATYSDIKPKNKLIKLQKNLPFKNQRNKPTSQEVNIFDCNYNYYSNNNKNPFNNNNNNNLNMLNSFHEEFNNNIDDEEIDYNNNNNVNNFNPNNLRFENLNINKNLNNNLSQPNSYLINNMFSNNHNFNSHNSNINNNTNYNSIQSSNIGLENVNVQPAKKFFSISKAPLFKDKTEKTFNTNYNSLKTNNNFSINNNTLQSKHIGLNKNSYEKYNNDLSKNINNYIVDNEGLLTEDLINNDMEKKYNINKTHFINNNNNPTYNPNNNSNPVQRNLLINSVLENYKNSKKEGFFNSSSRICYRYDNGEKKIYFENPSEKNDASKSLILPFFIYYPK